VAAVQGLKLIKTAGNNNIATVVQNLSVVATTKHLWKIPTPSQQRIVTKNREPNDMYIRQILKD